MFGYVDSILKKIFVGVWPGSTEAIDVAAVKAIVDLHMKPRDWALFERYASVFDVIDTKISNVITYLSIMITLNVGLVLYFQSKRPSFFLLGYKIEYSLLNEVIVCAMLVIVSIALRATRFWTFNPSYVGADGSRSQAIFEHELNTELAFRVAIHRFCLNISMLLSAAAIILFVISNRT